MTTAASILMRDFQPPSQAPANAQGPTNPAALQSEPETSLTMFPIMPVADVLITERRVCKACGNIQEAQSDRVHRLLSSCAGDPFKRVLRPRKPTEPPLDLKVEHFITVFSEHCACCWTPTHLWGEVWNIQPEPPARRPLTVMAAAFAASGDKSSPSQRVKAVVKMRQMTDEQAAEYL